MHRQEKTLRTLTVRVSDSNYSTHFLDATVVREGGPKNYQTIVSKYKFCRFVAIQAWLNWWFRGLGFRVFQARLQLSIMAANGTKDLGIGGLK